MLKQRILTAVILAPVVLAIIVYANAVFFTVFVGLLAAMIAYEWCQIVKPAKINSLIIASMLALTIMAMQSLSFVEIEAQRIFIAAAILWAICFVWLFKPQSGKHKYTIKYALGVGVLLLFGASLTALHQLPEFGIRLTLLLFAFVWTADIGAYVVGKSLGQHKLAKHISPGKTLEGLFGGLFFSAILAYFVARWLQVEWHYFVPAIVLITSISVIGDLFASLLKRHSKIKDSGFLLPGHGGFLDRFDALIAATPFYYVLLKYTLNYAQ